MPLAIHGVVVKTDGTRININIGDKETDPVFCITDLLPHLGQEQMQKNAAKVIEGEALDLLIGSRPVKMRKKKGFLNSLITFLKKSMALLSVTCYLQSLKLFQQVRHVIWALTALW